MAETKGGYAREMSSDYRVRQAEKLLEILPRTDMVITTALIPGRPAPVLMTQEMVEAMRPGSVIVDMAVERGGNVQVSKAGETAVHNGVFIIGDPNLPGRVATEFYDVAVADDEIRAGIKDTGIEELTPEDVAEAIRWAAAQPAHVNISALEITPRDQAYGGVKFTR